GTAGHRSQAPAVAQPARARVARAAAAVASGIVGGIRLDRAPRRGRRRDRSSWNGFLLRQRTARASCVAATVRAGGAPGELRGVPAIHRCGWLCRAALVVVRWLCRAYRAGPAGAALLATRDRALVRVDGVGPSRGRDGRTRVPPEPLRSGCVCALGRRAIADRGRVGDAREGRLERCARAI